MPHSTTPDKEDAMIVDGGNGTVEPETLHNTDDPAINEPNDDNQNGNGADNDITMADVGVEGDEIPQIKDEVKSEFKLESLFADIDSDDEFPSSAVEDTKVAPSSPEEPIPTL